MNNDKIAMVETNQGLMPLEDYLDIKAIQYGFDSYADMKACGCCIDTPPNIKINKYSADGLNLIDADIDKSTTNGILRFTHEITLTLQDDENLSFYSAYCCGVSEILWSEDEEFSFEETYPGLISKVREVIRAIE